MEYAARTLRRGEVPIDADALVSELHARNARRIYNLALRFAADAAEAEDLVQEVFLRVVRKVDQVDPARNVDAWLTRLATRVFLNHRPRRPRPAPLDAEPAAPPAAVTDGLEDARRLLRRLPPARRLVFILVHVDGHSPAEVAESTGIRLHTVKSHLKRARAAIRTWVDAPNGSDR